jgi:FixJ family two-component response regulator
MRRALSRLLRSYGLPVETHASAEEYLAAIHPSGVGCLLLDLQLDGMGGLDLMDLLADSGSLPPTVIISGHVSPVARERVSKRNVTILAKPIENAALVAEVGRLLGRNLRVDD